MPRNIPTQIHHLPYGLCRVLVLACLVFMASVLFCASWAAEDMNMEWEEFDSFDELPPPPRVDMPEYRESPFGDFDPLSPPPSKNLPDYEQPPADGYNPMTPPAQEEFGPIPETPYRPFKPLDPMDPMDQQ